MKNVPGSRTHQRPPCVKGAVILPCKMTGGLSFIVSTPPSKIKDFRHLPLHRGGRLSPPCGDVILQGKMTGPSRTPAPTNSIGVRCWDRRGRCHFAQCEMTGRGKPLPYEFYRGAVFFAPSLRGLSADQADWGSVVLKKYTPSIFGYAKSTSLREGGYFIAALRRCHFVRQNDREGQAPPLRILPKVQNKKKSWFEFPAHFSFFILHCPKGRVSLRVRLVGRCKKRAENLPSLLMDCYVIG